MTAKWTELIIDAADTESLAHWWAEVLGWARTSDEVDEEDGAVEIARPDGGVPTLVFVRVPEAKTVKNRLHIDVSPSGGSDQAAELERLLGLGARRVDVGQGEQTWVVLADPEGNEFCLLRTPA